MLDLVVVLIVLVVAMVGYLRGILREVLMLLALLVTYPASTALAPLLTRPVCEIGDLSDAVGYTVARIVGGLLIFMSLGLAVKIADKRFGHTQEGKVAPWNRWLGLAGGALVGMLLGFVVLCVADAFYKLHPSSENWLARAASRSWLRGAVDQSNPANRLLIADTLTMMEDVNKNPDRREEFQSQKIIQDLLAQPTIRAVIEDEELMDAIRRRDIRRAASDDKIHALLNDPEARRLIFSREMQETVRGLAEKWDAEEERRAAGHPIR